MLKSDQEYMRLALELGIQSAYEGEIPVGALVIDPYGEVIGRGRNRRQIEHDPTAHAEIVALREAARNLGGWNLSGCSLYVTLEPCPMCAGALVQARILRLVYGCANPKAGACGTLYDLTRDTRLFHRLQVVRGVMEQKCRVLLQDFFQTCREKNRKIASSSMADATMQASRGVL